MMSGHQSFENQTMDVDAMLSLDGDTALPTNLSNVYGNANTAMLPLPTGIAQISPYGTYGLVVRSNMLRIHINFIICILKTNSYSNRVVESLSLSTDSNSYHDRV